ncbi:hypothetical protein ONA92_03995 [Mycobacteroides salmoniphilum]|uniref:hypothetical protein n=1 Tax=Mycobacteroides salmoniphilum TaxID=404941 RepID=UPI003568706B
MTWPVDNDTVDHSGPDDPLSHPLPQGVVLPGGAALDAPGSDLTQYYIGEDGLRVFELRPDSGQPKKKPVDLAHVTKFIDGYNGIVNANDKGTVARDVDQWFEAANALRDAVTRLNVLGNNKQLQGNTVKKIIDNVNLLTQSITPTAAAAERMKYLSLLFASDIEDTRNWFKTPGWSEIARSGTPEQKQVLDAWAHRTVRLAYNPPIEVISSHHPDIPPKPPEVDPNPAANPTPMASSPGPGPGGKTPPGLKLSGLGDPSDWRETNDPRDNRNQNQNQNQGLDPSSALDAASNAGKEAGDAASKTAESAGKTAQDALSELLKGKDGPGQTGGLLGAGAIPVSAVGRNGAAGLGKIGGGSVPRVGTGAPPAMPTVKPTEPSVTATKASAETSASRASVSNGASSGSGAGAPHAGGGSPAGKVHKTNKALRHDKHGVVDEDVAVVPVVGEEPTASVPAKST